MHAIAGVVLLIDFFKISFVEKFLEVIFAVVGFVPMVPAPVLFISSMVEIANNKGVGVVMVIVEFVDLTVPKGVVAGVQVGVDNSKLFFLLFVVESSGENVAVVNNVIDDGVVIMEGVRVDCDYPGTGCVVSRRDEIVIGKNWLEASDEGVSGNPNILQANNIVRDRGPKRLREK